MSYFIRSTLIKQNKNVFKIGSFKKRFCTLGYFCIDDTHKSTSCAANETPRQFESSNKFNFKRSYSFSISPSQ